jgi:hypothetical protein
MRVIYTSCDGNLRDVEGLSMSDVSKWPTYPIGPESSVFALGVVSVNYARLEHAVHGMFAVILGITGDVSYRLMYKIGPEMRDRLMREMLPTRKWPANVMDLANHFLKAHKTCYENRNLLMHSNLVTGSARTIVLYKTGRDGKTTLVNPLLKELRQVADDMKTYFDFGLHLSNMINFDLLGAKPQPGDLSFREWPDKPPLPVPLVYTSDPMMPRSLE